MNIQCESCEARYKLDERLFRDAKAVRAKCRRCGEYIVVTRPEAPEAFEAPPVVTPSEPVSAAPPADEPSAPPLTPPPVAAQEAVGMPPVESREAEATPPAEPVPAAQPDAELSAPSMPPPGAELETPEAPPVVEPPAEPVPAAPPSVWAQEAAMTYLVVMPTEPVQAAPPAEEFSAPSMPPPGAELEAFEVPPMPPLTAEPPAPEIPPTAAETVLPPPPGIPAAFEEVEAKMDEEEFEFEQFLARLKGSIAAAPPPPEKKPLRFVPSQPKEEWPVRALPTVRPAPPPSPSVGTPAPPVSPPAATAGEAEAETQSPAAGTSFLGNLVLFPSEANVSPSPTDEKQPPEPPSEPPLVPRPEPPLATPPDPTPAPTLDPVRAARMSPTYTISRSVVLDPKTLEENRIVAFFPDSPELGPYRVLRTRILQAAEKKGGNTVMITSALPGEGKTVTAINLALTFSKTYLQTALLVDCDLRQQRVHEVLGFESTLGLGDYLTDGCPVSDMIVWPGVEKLTLISGGKTVSESSELLGSPAMRALVEDMEARYPNRYIFFDVPPVLAGADALAFAPLVDHILLVVQADATPLPEVQRALEMLPKEKVIGLVLNRQKYF